MGNFHFVENTPAENVAKAQSMVLSNWLKNEIDAERCYDFIKELSGVSFGIVFTTFGGSREGSKISFPEGVSSDEIGLYFKDTFQV